MCVCYQREKVKNANICFLLLLSRKPLNDPPINRHFLRGLTFTQALRKSERQHKCRQPVKPELFNGKSDVNEFERKN